MMNSLDDSSVSSPAGEVAFGALGFYNTDFLSPSVTKKGIQMSTRLGRADIDWRIVKAFIEKTKNKNRANSRVLYQTARK